MLELVARKEASRFMLWLTPALAVILTMLSGLALFAVNLGRYTVPRAKPKFKSFSAAGSDLIRQARQLDESHALFDKSTREQCLSCIRGFFFIRVIDSIHAARGVGFA